MRPLLEEPRERAQPPVSPEVLHKLEQKLAADSKSYYLVDSQNRRAVPVNLCCDALKEYLCRVVVEDMPKPRLTPHPPDGAIQVETLEKFIKIT